MGHGIREIYAESIWKAELLDGERWKSPLDVRLSIWGRGRGVELFQRSISGSQDGFKVCPRILRERIHDGFTNAASGPGSHKLYLQ
jgi:hypothetical protein